MHKTSQTDSPSNSDVFASHRSWPPGHFSFSRHSTAAISLTSMAAMNPTRIERVRIVWRFNADSLCECAPVSHHETCVIPCPIGAASTVYTMQPYRRGGVDDETRIERKLGMMIGAVIGDALGDKCVVRTIRGLSPAPSTPFGVGRLV